MLTFKKLNPFSKKEWIGTTTGGILSGGLIGATAYSIGAMSGPGIFLTLATPAILGSIGAAYLGYGLVKMCAKGTTRSVRAAGAYARVVEQLDNINAFKKEWSLQSEEQKLNRFNQAFDNTFNEYYEDRSIDSDNEDDDSDYEPPASPEPTEGYIFGRQTSPHPTGRLRRIGGSFDEIGENDEFDDDVFTRNANLLPSYKAEGESFSISSRPRVLQKGVHIPPSEKPSFSENQENQLPVSPTTTSSRRLGWKAQVNASHK